MPSQRTPLPSSLPLLALLALSTLSVTCATAVSYETATIQPGLVHTEAKRSTDLRTHIEETTLELKLENQGNTDADYYIVAIPQYKAAHLSFIKANRGNKALDVQRVEVAGSKGKTNVFYRVKLNKALKAGDSITFTVFLVFTHRLHPFPEAIAQNDAQLVKYIDDAYFYTPYKSLSQSSQFSLATDHVESYTSVKPTRRERDVVHYGPYTDVAPFTNDEITIHYENNYPFVTMRTMVKEIEVSHWGNVAVEEKYLLKHTGAALKGSFSRHEYQRAKMQGVTNGKASFRSLVANLPAHAQDIYYRDGIGNISTSNVRNQRDKVHFEVEPRFPMFGGWKTDFSIFYSLPGVDVLSTDASDSTRFVLDMAFSSPFDQAVVDTLELRVVLPEGSANIEYITPFPVDSVGHDVRFTYLDTTGRPVLILRKSNLVRYHNTNFQVVYHFSNTMLLREPALLVFLFFCFFLASMVYVRINLSISGNNDKGRTRHFGVAGDIARDILMLYPQMEEQLSKGQTAQARDKYEKLQVKLADLKKADATLEDAIDDFSRQLVAMRNLAKNIKAGAGSSVYNEAVRKAEETLSELLL